MSFIDKKYKNACISNFIFIIYRQNLKMYGKTSFLSIFFKIGPSEYFTPEQKNFVLTQEKIFRLVKPWARQLKKNFQAHRDYGRLVYLIIERAKMQQSIHHVHGRLKRQTSRKLSDMSNFDETWTSLFDRFWSAAFLSFCDYNSYFTNLYKEKW